MKNIVIFTLLGNRGTSSENKQLATLYTIHSIHSDQGCLIFGKPTQSLF